MPDAQLSAPKHGRSGWATGDHDRGHVRADRAHQLRRDRLVTASEEHDAVERIGAETLFDVHRHQIAVQHRRRLHQLFPERDRRELEREATRREHAATYRVRDRAEVEVAVHELRRRVADSHYRLAGERGGREALGPQRGAVDKPGEVPRREPAGAAQVPVAA